MLFSKDEEYGQLPYTITDNFKMIKVLISCIFCALGLFFVISGNDNILGLLVLVLGAIWNLYLPLNNYYGVSMSIMVGIVYALICINVGLVANAFLYIAYYVPMQYIACKKLTETSIIKGKILSVKQSAFVLFYYILFFIGVYIFSTSIATSWLCFLDALSATLLAFSSMLRTIRTSEYIRIRLLALGVSILLWALIASSTAFYPGAFCVLVMYIMYFVYDIAEHIFAQRYFKHSMIEHFNQFVQDTRKTLLTVKKEAYSKLSDGQQK